MFFRFFMVLLVFLAGYASYHIYHFSKINDSITKTETFYTIGPETAEVSVIEFVDYRCPPCRETHPTIKQVIKLRSDIRFVIRPIGLVDDQSEYTAKIALAAGLQNKFWTVHNALMESPEGILDQTSLQKLASIHNINYDQLIRDSESTKVQELLDQNFEAAAYSGLDSVPFFLIEEKSYVPTEKIPNVAEFLRLLPRQPS